MTTVKHDDFVSIVRALGPYLDQLVVVGAWCHRLLQFHALASPPAFLPLMTEDADVATPERLEARAHSLDAALTAAGFQARLSGDGHVPVTKYYRQGDENALYVEFIAPLRGSGYTRNGEPERLLAVAGITAQRLRYVELLLFEPWRYRLSDAAAFDTAGGELVIQIANPASYLAQKVLTLERRHDEEKRPKDALYIHDTLTMFGDSFSTLREMGEQVLERLPKKTQGEFQRLRTEIFADRDLIVGAARIAAATGRANPPSAETIATVCTVGLEQIFGQ